MRSVKLSSSSSSTSALSSTFSLLSSSSEENARTCPRRMSKPLRGFLQDDKISVRSPLFPAKYDKLFAPCWEIETKK